MAGENGDRRITWKVVAGAAGTLVLILFSLLYNAQDKRLNAAEASIAKKVDKTEHEKDIQYIRSLFEIIRDDIKQHEENSRVRGGR